ncbi:MAG: bifunctional folylpolyglutamate synthase/dihydrofolate synthase [candidate division WOR-3 bacterium]|nr:bifunctional folylpolyglutamate synthase/dihydrofolate synthase [candidate division WOR-3 bacterium]MCX7836734.1 bifunctional folylpolyglutamate synthase/dihydrofolate synthase [candidate division WOR-3 bacterium]MDW8113369.1 folylpolyglutamate synthase/dihydrofolate synthase family protein [candidate division WOR-3 bacterium]
MNSYKKAINFLSSLINYERKKANYNDFKLIRFLNFLAEIGNPHLFLKNPILIAGTKGKGSTTMLLGNCLKECGYKVGIYTSPHLVSFRERIQFQNNLIDKEEFTELTFQLKKMIKKHKLTFFESLTAIAFLFFLRKEHDFIVLEVGLGGRLDATNVVNPIISIIARIDYDHTEILGNTLAKIAYEKAGIIHKEVPLVTFRQKKSVDKVFQRVCSERNSPIFYSDDYFSFQLVNISPQGTSFCVNFLKKTFEENLKSDIIHTNLIGEFQKENIGLALTALFLLSKEHKLINYSSIKKGISNVPLLGRISYIPYNGNFFIIDTAHNPISIKSLKETLIKMNNLRRYYFLFGVAKDKDSYKMLKHLKPICEEIVFTKAKTKRATPLNRLKKIAQQLKLKHRAFSSVKKAFNYIFKKANKEKKLLVVTGSFYLAGDILRLIHYNKK